VVLEEVVEILDGFFKISTLIEHMFGYPYEGTIFVRYNGGSPGDIVYE